MGAPFRGGYYWNNPKWWKRCWYLSSTHPMWPMWNCWAFPPHLLTTMDLHWNTSLDLNSTLNKRHPNPKYWRLNSYPEEWHWDQLHINHIRIFHPLREGSVTIKFLWRLDMISHVHVTHWSVVRGQAYWLWPAAWAQPPMSGLLLPPIMGIMAQKCSQWP